MTPPKVVQIEVNGEDAGFALLLNPTVSFEGHKVQTLKFMMFEDDFEYSLSLNTLRNFEKFKKQIFEESDLN